MKARSRYAYAALFILLGSLLVSLGGWLHTFHASSIEGRLGAQEFRPVELPWSFQRRGVAHLRMDIEHTFLGPTQFRIIPDNQITRMIVNDQQVDLSHIPAEALHDYLHGFELNLREYLQSGKNHLSIVFVNTGGPGKMAVSPVMPVVPKFLYFLGFALIAATIGLLLRVSLVQYTVTLVALILMVVYWGKTDWDERAHDVFGDTGHIGYVEYILDKERLPLPNEGWTFYHPPAYYLSATVIAKWADWIDADRKVLLQAYSVFLWLVFLLASLSVIRFLTRNAPGLLLPATVSLALWPSTIIHGLRIGNDVAFYAASGLAFLGLMHWWQTDKRRFLLMAAFFTLLSLLVKSNGIIIGACLFLSVVYKFLTTHEREAQIRKIIDGAIVGIFIGLGICASFAVRIYYYLKGDINNWLISNANTLHIKLKVPADIKAFIPLDVPTFITSPFMSSWEDEQGRYNFWNFLLRSALTGEFSFAGVVPAVVAVIWGILLIVLLGRSLLSLRDARMLSKTTWDQWLPLALLISLSLLSLIIFRIILPYACSNDFRYILPILPAVLVLISMTGKANRVMLYTVALGSAAFFISMPN